MYISDKERKNKSASCLAQEIKKLNLKKSGGRNQKEKRGHQGIRKEGKNSFAKSRS